MDAQLVTLIIAVVLLALVAGGVWFYMRKRRSDRLRSHFGPEYDRTVEQFHDRDLAETELQQRAARVERYRIVPLSAEDCSRYQESWKAVQSRFVDDPPGAVEQANELINEVMGKRGYPVSTFEQAAADLSVEHPNVVSNYRAASRLAELNKRRTAKTEELRQALVYYRALFTDLLDTGSVSARRDQAVRHQPERPEGAARKPNGGGLRT
jgi:hypothetical protein